MTTEEKVAQAFLGLRKAFCDQETKRLNAAVYDVPCDSFQNTEEEILFHLHVYNFLDCFTSDQLNTLMSRSNRLARNCASCSVSSQEIADWLASAEGILITSKLS